MRVSVQGGASCFRVRAVCPHRARAARSFPYCAVSIGLAIGHRPVIGVVYNPILDKVRVRSE